MMHTVGVLALQGAFAQHIRVLESLGVGTREVRTAGELAGCDALVIPGGESTVLTRHLMEQGTGYGTGTPWRPLPLFDALRDFARSKPVMGTCAGLIILARDCGDERVVPLEALPVTVERNAYGRQTESFVRNIALELPKSFRQTRSTAIPADAPYPATFIRAPRIVGVEKDVAILASVENAAGGLDPVMVQFGKILALTFHPELTPHDARIHEYFISLIE